MENINFLKNHVMSLIEYEPELTEKIDESILEILLKAEAKDLTNRKSKIHLSASAVIFKNKKCYFIRHPYLKTTLLPAGHVENDEMPLDTAVREFFEETGFSAVVDKKMKNFGLIDVNVIEIPENSLKNEEKHIHIDFRYKLLLDEERERQEAELKCFLLAEDEASGEFKRYYKYL